MWTRFLAATCLLLSLAPSAGAEPAFVLGPDGAVYFWREGDAALGPLPAALARLNTRPVNDLGASGDGAVIVALPAEADGARAKNRRHEGSALVISVPPGDDPPSILKEIAFDGIGRRVVVSPDGRRAFLLSLRVGPEGAAATRIWLHALDLEAGRVESSAQLDAPPADLAFDSGADRLYLAYAGRVVSYTTHPLARSWHFRSPGENRVLFVRPQGGVLYALRTGQVALFDPAVIAAMKPEDRQKRVDDATSLARLPFTAHRLLLSRDGLLAAGVGPANEVVFFDAVSARVFTVSDGAGFDRGQELRVFRFDAGRGPLLAATFPGGRVSSVVPPAAALERESPPPQVPVETVPVAPPVPPEPRPSPAAAPTPEVPRPAVTLCPPLTGQSVLAGRLTGRVEAVASIVIYGPGSIIREQARARPDADGVWRIPLPAPGIYRIVPVGEGSRPLRSDPNFHTVEVIDRGRIDLDFRIEGTD